MQVIRKKSEKEQFISLLMSLIFTSSWENEDLGSHSEGQSTRVGLTAVFMAVTSFQQGQRWASKTTFMDESTNCSDFYKMACGHDASGTEYIKGICDRSPSSDQ